MGGGRRNVVALKLRPEPHRFIQCNAGCSQDATPGKCPPRYLHSLSPLRYALRPLKTLLNFFAIDILQQLTGNHAITRSSDASQFAPSLASSTGAMLFITAEIEVAGLTSATLVSLHELSCQIA